MLFSVSPDDTVGILVIDYFADRSHKRYTDKLPPPT